MVVPVVEDFVKIDEESWIDGSLGTNFFKHIHNELFCRVWQKPSSLLCISPFFWTAIHEISLSARNALHLIFIFN